MKYTLLLIIAAVLALGGGIMAKRYVTTLENSSPMPLTDFSLQDLAGKPHRLSDWQGKVRVINFWATWCPPCLKEIPEFIAMQQQYSAQGLQFIGIAIDDKAAVAEFVNTTPINYPVLMASAEGIGLARELGNRFDTVPFSVIVDQHGSIIYRQQGELSREQILEIITPLLR